MVSGFMNQLGVRVLISPVDPSDFFQSWQGATPTTPCNLARGNFDVALFARASSMDTAMPYDIYHSSQFEPGGRNDSRVHNADLDAALAVAAGSMDADKVRAAMFPFQEVFAGSVVEIPLYRHRDVALVDPGLVNFEGNASAGGPFWNVQHWWLQP